MSKFYAYCLTINNYTAEECIKELPKVLRYMVYGKEVGEEGTPHLQMFVYYKNQATFSAVKKRFPRAHIEVKAKDSTFKDAINYCKKGEQPKLEWIEWKEYGPNWGRNADVTELGEPPQEQGENINLWEQIAKEIEENTYSSFQELSRAYPEYAIRYNRGLKDYFEAHKIKYKFSIKDKYGGYNELQQRIINYISTTKPNREILWIYDKTGGNGKSEMASELATTHGWLCLGNARTADIAYAWNGENVIFDFSRTTMERINYDVIEQLLNGRVFSTKYESGTKVYNKPLVIALANFMPDQSAMTQDRWNIWEI